MRASDGAQRVGGEVGDVLVVADRHALGRDADEESRTIAALRDRGVIVKVLGHGPPTGVVPTIA